jgi:hypothetical protein
MIYRAGISSPVAVLGLLIVKCNRCIGGFFYSCIRLAYKLWSVNIVKQTAARQGSKPVACSEASTFFL